MWEDHVDRLDSSGWRQGPRRPMRNYLVRVNLGAPRSRQ